MNLPVPSKTNKFVALALLAAALGSPSVQAAVSITQVSVGYFHTSTMYGGPGVAPFAPFSVGDIVDDYTVGVYRHEEFLQTGADVTSLVTIDVKFSESGDLNSLMLGQYVSAEGIVSLQYHNFVYLSAGSEDSKMYVYTQPTVGSAGNGLAVQFEVSRYVPPGSYSGGLVSLDGSVHEYDLLAGNTYRLNHTAGTDLAPPIAGSESNKVLITFGAPPTTEQIANFNQLSVIPEPSSAIIGALFGMIVSVAYRKRR